MGGPATSTMQEQWGNLLTWLRRKSSALSSVGDHEPPGYVELSPLDGGEHASLDGYEWNVGNEASSIAESLPPYIHLDQSLAQEPMDLVISKHRFGTKVTVETRTSDGGLKVLYKTQIEFFIPPKKVRPAAGLEVSSVKLRLLDGKKKPVLDVVQTGDRSQFHALLPCTRTLVMSITSDVTKTRTEVRYTASSSPDMQVFWDEAAKHRVLWSCAHHADQAPVGSMTCPKGALIRKVYLHVLPGQSCLFLSAVALSLMEKEYIMGVASFPPDML